MVDFLARTDLLASRPSCDLPAGPPPAPAPPIGVVVFTTHRGEIAEAVLDSAGTWRCACLPVLDRVLNALFAPGSRGERDDTFGHAEVVRVAAWIKRRVRRVEIEGRGDLST